MYAGLTTQANTAIALLDGASELAPIGHSAGDSTGSGTLPFSDLLGENLQNPSRLFDEIGKALPEDGKQLPLFESLDLTEGSPAVSTDQIDSLPVNSNRSSSDITAGPLLMAPSLSDSYDLPVITSLERQLELAIPKEAILAHDVPVAPIISSLPTGQASASPQLSDDLQVGARLQPGDQLQSGAQLLSGAELRIGSELKPELLSTPTVLASGIQRSAISANSLSSSVVTSSDEILGIADDAPDALKENWMATLAQKANAIAVPQRASGRVHASPTVTREAANPLPVTMSQPGSANALQSSDAATDLINSPVRTAAWGEKLGERVLMLSGSQLKTAEIRLTPADLGPLRVRVSIEDGAANINFQVNHAVTRDAIEQAMPKLRELLAENGLSLGQADVSDRDVAGGEQDEQFSDSNTVTAVVEEQNDQETGQLSVRQNSVGTRGLLDTFV